MLCSCTLLQTALFYYKIIWKRIATNLWYHRVKQQCCCADYLKASFVHGTGLLIIFLILPWDCTRDFFTEFQYIRVEMRIVSEMAKVTMVKQIPNTAPGRFLRPMKYEKNLDLIWKHDNCICVRLRFFLWSQIFNCYQSKQLVKLIFWAVMKWVILQKSSTDGSRE